VRAAVVFATVLAFSPAAAAAGPPTLAVSASTRTGPAPFRVVFTATGGAISYHWTFGDGTAGDGQTLEHIYRAGAFRARVTATNAAGETATASTRVVSLALTLRARGVVTYGGHLRFRGRLVPALTGLRVGLFAADGHRAARGRTHGGGRFLIGAPIRSPGAYKARFHGALSNPVSVTVRPTISARLLGSGIVGRPLRLAFRVRPAVAGRVRIDVTRGRRRVLAAQRPNGATIRLPSGRAGRYSVVLTTVPTAGYVAGRATLEKLVVYPRLALGSTGPSVLALNQALSRLHIAIAGIDTTYGVDTRDAVIALQKLHRLPRTGSVDSRLWRVLLSAWTPRPRSPGNHLEVDKERQVLFVVRNGRVILVSHVSTGATGNTPVGRWYVYSKAPGWLGLMFDSSFFLRGFAIHGYPEVPVYPGSHGCVRLPLWLAPRVYRYDPPGSVVDIY
jgi:PKD repeat protein